jgi:hypothetical protein
MQGSRDTLSAPRRAYQQFGQREGTAGMLGGDLGWQRGRQVLPPGRGGAQRHSGCQADQVVTVAGLSQDEPPLAALHPEPPGEQRPVISLTVNLAVNSLQFGLVRSGLPAIELLQRYARRGHDHLLR